MKKDHLINSRALSILHPLKNELIIHPQKNYLFDLEQLAVLNVDGEKAIEFLQGQLTCDMRLLSDIRMIQGAQCNLKGRILSLLDVILWNGVLLIVPHDLLEATQSSLSKTAALSRVSLCHTNKMRVLGFYLQNSQDLLPEITFFPDSKFGQSYGVDFCYYHLGNGYYLLIVHQERAERLLHSYSLCDQVLGSLTWHTLRLRDKQLNIYPESRGLFLPHRLDLHTTPYLSFDKGCYKGQEIIARTHYRATLKHELALFTTSTPHPIYSGQKIFHPQEHREIGEIIDYSYLDTHHYLIAASMLKEKTDTICLDGSQDVIVIEKVRS